MVRRLVAFAVVAASIGVGAGVSPAGAEPPAQRRETLIVELHETSDDPGAIGLEVASEHGGRRGFVYRHAVQGFTVEVPEGRANAIARDPRVKAVSHDEIVTVAATDPTLQQYQPVGIDRIDADVNPPDAAYDPAIGRDSDTDVDIAIIDSGIDPTHPDLDARLFTDCTNGFWCTGSGDHSDGNGHGTHVAGIAAAVDNDIGTVGVAPGARLWAIKVLNADGTGSLGAVVAGVDVVTANAAEIEVANMSLGGNFSNSTLNTAISNSVAAGVVYAVAAGNSSTDASTFSPASHPDVVTVSALSDLDGAGGGAGQYYDHPDKSSCSEADETLASFSNWGAPVDIAAPGVCILSTFKNGGYGWGSGTSMASPYVAGAIARYLAENPGATPTNKAGVDAVVSTLLADAIPQADPDCGFSGDPDGLPEPVLTVGGPAFGGPPGWTCQVAPNADFTYSCAGLSCSFDASTSTGAGASPTYSWTVEGQTTAPSSVPTATHEFSAAGDHEVTVEVVGDDGIADLYRQTVTVAGTPPVDDPPVAAFTYACTDNACDFDATGSTDDNGITSYEWEFGNEGTGSGMLPTYTFATAGPHQVTLTVTDTIGQTSVYAEQVTVTMPPAAPTLAVHDLSLSFKGKRTKTPTGQVVVVDEAGSKIEGATVTGTFSTGGGGTAVTNRKGKAKLTGDKVRSGDVVTFCVTAIVAAGYEDYAGSPADCVTLTA